MLEEPRNTVEGTMVIRRASPAGMRTRVEPARIINTPELRTRVPVVYYLCRNRLLEHPHFMEVPLASPQAGLYLTDVMNRLDALRGKGMAAMYSWSCKRRYKNGFVWHDLCQDDLLLPAQGNEYVLKGSELLRDQPRSLPQRHGQNNIGTSHAKVECPKPTQQESSSPSPRSQTVCTSLSPSASPRAGSPIPVTKEAAPAQPPLPSTFASTIMDEKQCRTPRACSSSPKTSMSSSAAAAGEQSFRSESLQSLIKAEAASRKGVVMDQEDKTGSSSSKLKPSSLLMRLMACGPNSPGLGSFSELELPTSPLGVLLEPSVVTVRASETKHSSGSGRLHESHREH